MRRLVGRRPLLLVATGILVRAADGTILLQRRTDDGLSRMPGGALEPGETLEDAARPMGRARGCGSGGPVRPNRRS
jgi:8-oxo-dGTP pyrophosphatase MutT (NUDIX family)